MRQKISRRLTFIAAVLGVCAIVGVAGAQLYPQVFNFVDVKSDGTRVRLFGNNGVKVHYLNFKGGATINTGTSALDVGGNFATSNVTVKYLDLTPSPTPTPSPSQVCTPEGRLATWAGSATQKSVTYQCCQDGAGHIYWKLGLCP